MTSKSTESGNSRFLLITGLTVTLMLVIVLTFWLIGVNRPEPWQAEIVIDPSIGRNDSLLNREKFVKTRIALLKSIAVLNDAILISGFHDIEFEDLYLDLEVSPSENGIRVSYLSKDPVRSEKIVTSVIEAYQNFFDKLNSKGKPKSGRNPQKSRNRIRTRELEMCSNRSIPLENQNGDS